MIRVNVEHRVLAAIRFLDEETRLPVRTALKVAGAGMKIVRNVSGLHVVMDAPGLSDYAARFEPPVSAPSSTPFTLTVSDPSRAYLSRSFTLTLPRDTTPGPDETLPSNSVFKPLDVMLYPSSIARANAGSAVVRIRVQDKNGVPLPSALVQLSLAAPALQRRGLADERGESLVLIPGIPIADWSDPEATTEFAFTVKAAWTNAAPPPDPEALAAALQDVTGTIKVATGQEVSKTVHLDWIEL